MEPIVSTSWLAERLGSPTLRVFDAAVNIDARTRRLESGRSAYEQARIPGAAFLDLLGDLSDESSEMPLMCPPPDILGARFGAVGIGEDSEVVLYSSNHPMWATRVWWMLNSIGFENKAVLDGSLATWKAEGRPLDTGSATYPAAQLAVQPRPELWADKADVAAARDVPGTAVVCALGRDVYAGTSEHNYGRPGHIAGSLNVPYSHVVDPETHMFRPLDEMRTAFTEAGVLNAERVVMYCGGGISATTDALALHLLGHEQVSVYDASLHEWANDPAAPMETA